jgi:hypothetical protein
MEEEGLLPNSFDKGRISLIAKMTKIVHTHTHYRPIFFLI